MIIRFGRLRTTFVELRQHHLDDPRVLADLGRQRDRLGRRDNVTEIDDAALGFRHDLLRDHHHVAVTQHLAGAVEAGQDHRRQIVAGAHHRQAG